MHSIIAQPCLQRILQKKMVECVNKYGLNIALSSNNKSMRGTEKNIEHEYNIQNRKGVKQDKCDYI